MWTPTDTAETEPTMETETELQAKSNTAEADSDTDTDPESDTDSVPTLEEMALLLEPDPELTEDEKVLQGLHLVCCKGFTEYDPKKRHFVCTRFCNFNIAFFDLDEECEYSQPFH
jgi:hypothetical protein